MAFLKTANVKMTSYQITEPYPHYFKMLSYVLKIISVSIPEQKMKLPQKD